MSARVTYLSTSEFHGWVKGLRRTPLTLKLFSPETLGIMDGATGLYVDDRLVGVTAIIAREIPRISAIYVIPEFRGKGYGTFLLQLTLEICDSMKLTPIHVTAGSRSLSRILALFTTDLVHVEPASINFDLLNDF